MDSRQLYTIDGFTITLCVFIIVAFALSWYYIARTKNKDIEKKRKWMEQLPSLVSTLGVFGTFLGITKGLMSFDTTNLSASIPMLLDGMKTAFFTSLFGMLGSMILNRVLSRKLDEIDGTQESDTIKAANMIIKSLSHNTVYLETAIRQSANKVTDSTNQLATTITNNEVVKKISIDVEQAKDDIEEMKGRAEERNTKLDQLQIATQNVREEVAKFRALALTATVSVSSVDNTAQDIKNKFDEIDEVLDDIKDLVEKSQQ